MSQPCHYAHHSRPRSGFTHNIHGCVHTAGCTLQVGRARIQGGDLGLAAASHILLGGVRGRGGVLHNIHSHVICAGGGVHQETCRQSGVLTDGINVHLPNAVGGVHQGTEGEVGILNDGVHGHLLIAGGGVSQGGQVRVFGMADSYPRALSSPEAATACSVI